MTKKPASDLYHLTNPDHPFARTNIQTIQQRAEILCELLPGVQSIAEICCGDCRMQAQVYREQLGIQIYRGLDISAEIVAFNQVHGIDCMQGDALSANTMRQFLVYEVIFFGPPLSMDCDGHRLLTFPQVVPAYSDFIRLLLGELGYQGTLVCISPRDTTLGDAQLLYQQIKTLQPAFGLRLIHYSHATITGLGEAHEPRLKYVELWYSSKLEDLWERR
jgi:hypothetical protein